MADGKRRPAREPDRAVFRRARAWLLGTGLLAAHVGAYLLGATGLLLLNLLRSPHDLWFWEPLRAWGVLLAAHAAAVAASAAVRDVVMAGHDRAAATDRAPSPRDPAPTPSPARPAPARVRLARRLGAGVRSAAGAAVHAAPVRATADRSDAQAPRSPAATEAAYGDWGRPVADRPAVGRVSSAKLLASARSRAHRLLARTRPRRPPVPVGPSRSDATPTEATPPGESTVIAATAPAPRPWASPADEGVTRPGPAPGFPNRPDPLHVPAIFVLRPEHEPVERPGSGWTAPTSAPSSPAQRAEHPAGEDIVLAGPSPLDAQRLGPDVDWSWMEAAAAAWLALREVDVARSAPVADGLAQAPPNPSSPRDHHAGAG